MQLRRNAIALSAGLVLLVSACAEEPDDGSADSTSSSASSSTSESESSSSESSAPSSSAGSSSAASDAPSFPAEAAPTSTAASPDAAGVLTTITVTAEGGYDRIAISFDGPGTPGVVAQYTDTASRQGKGDPIEIPGAATMLDLIISGTTYPQGAGGLAAGIQPGTGTAVIGVFNDGTFEGQTHIVIGLSAQAPYVITSQASPPQIIVDIKA